MKERAVNKTSEYDRRRHPPNDLEDHLSNSVCLQLLNRSSDSGAAAGMHTIQRDPYKVDRKKEKWKLSHGKKGWKHGRKLLHDQKEPEWEEPEWEEPEPAAEPIISDRLKEGGFSEANYLFAGSILYSYYMSGGIDRIKSIISIPEQKADEDDATYDKTITATLEANSKKLCKDPEIWKLFSQNGNCGCLAKFLYDEEEEPKKGGYADFMAALSQKILPNKVKLIRVMSNIGHAFTLICYQQQERTAVELIQAWQDAYSVTKSLSKGAVYWIESLIPLFNSMREDITGGAGLSAFKKLFLMSVPKAGIERFDITHMNIRIINEKPEEYAERMLKKKVDSD